MKQQAVSKKQANRKDRAQHAANTPLPTRASNEHSLAKLHQTIGNHGMLRRRGPAIQARLRIGSPRDRYEREADRVAEQVMRMPKSAVQRRSSKEKDLIQAEPMTDQITPLAQRQPEPEEDEEEQEPIQTKAVSGQAPRVTPEVQAQIKSLRGTGRPLPEPTRAFFESRFGSDLSQVRVHTGAQAAETARALNARAFTVGRDVVFERGKFAPDTVAGQRLIAHELAHVSQQTTLATRLVQRQRRIDDEDAYRQLLESYKGGRSGAKLRPETKRLITGARYIRRVLYRNARNAYFVLGFLRAVLHHHQARGQLEDLAFQYKREHGVSIQADIRKLVASGSLLRKPIDELKSEFPLLWPKKEKEEWRFDRWVREGNHERMLKARLDKVSDWPEDVTRLITKQRGDKEMIVACGRWLIRHLDEIRRNRFVYRLNIAWPKKHTLPKREGDWTRTGDIRFYVAVKRRVDDLTTEFHRVPINYIKAKKLKALQDRGERRKVLNVRMTNSLLLEFRTLFAKVAKGGEYARKMHAQIDDMIRLNNEKLESYGAEILIKP